MQIRRLLGAAIATATLVFTLGATSAPANAASERSAAHGPGAGSDYHSLKASPSDPAVLRGLDQQAREEGLAPVIVGLEVDAQAEGLLPPQAQASQRAQIARVRAALIHELRGTRYTHLKVTDAVPYVAAFVSPEALAVLEASSNVAGVERDDVLTLSDEEADASAPHATSGNTNLPNYWDLKRIQATTAQANGYTGRGQTIAVLDTGVQRTHPELSGKVVAEACYSTYSYGSTAGGCPNGRWNQTGSGAATPCTYHVAKCKHGTHVAGTAAGYNVGVANRASVIAVQITHNGNGVPLSYQSDQLWGLSYVYGLRSTYSIAAANISFGGGFNAGYCDGLEGGSYYSWVATLRAVGIATVVSSGNNGYINGISSPACVSNVVSVGNSTLDAYGRDAVYSGSNQASFLSLLAPGTQICSSVPTSRYECGWVGTSMAAPHVTGAFALLKQLRPSTSVTGSLTALRASGVGVADYRGYVVPRINVWSALGYLYSH